MSWKYLDSPAENFGGHAIDYFKFAPAVQGNWRSGVPSKVLCHSSTERRCILRRRLTRRLHSAAAGLASLGGAVTKGACPNAGYTMKGTHVNEPGLAGNDLSDQCRPVVAAALDPSKLSSPLSLQQVAASPKTVKSHIHSVDESRRTPVAARPSAAGPQHRQDKRGSPSGSVVAGKSRASISSQRVQPDQERHRNGSRATSLEASVVASATAVATPSVVVLPVQIPGHCCHRSRCCMNNDGQSSFKLNQETTSPTSTAAVSNEPLSRPGVAAGQPPSVHKRACNGPLNSIETRCTSANLPTPLQQDRNVVSLENSPRTHPQESSKLSNTGVQLLKNGDSISAMINPAPSTTNATSNASHVPSTPRLYRLNDAENFDSGECATVPTNPALSSHSPLPVVDSTTKSGPGPSGITPAILLVFAAPLALGLLLCSYCGARCCACSRGSSADPPKRPEGRWFSREEVEAELQEATSQNRR